MAGTERAAGAVFSGDLPRWNLGPIYPSVDSPEYARDRELLSERSRFLLSELESAFPADPPALEARILRTIALLEEAGDLSENLEAYAYAVYSTDTRDSRALGAINAVEELSLPLAKAAVVFRERLASRSDEVRALLSSPSAEIAPYAFFLSEQLELASKQMPSELEDLANDLSRSGGDAWGRLQEALSSTATTAWTEGEGGETVKKTVVALRNLAFDPDRSVRERAFRAELAAWKAVEIPMAAALNGVKGFYTTVNKRRGWEDAVAKSAFQARLSRKALDSLILAMEESLPIFRRYLKAKASLLGVPACAFFDLFAPVGASDRRWSFAEGRDFIVDRFSAFDPGLGNFARHAFEFGWIDAEPREGKVGGAYCTDFPLKGDSRILCNYEGSFSSLTTVAHELGHAYHHEVLKDLPRTLSGYPMTLAETASIFSETIVFENALERSRAEGNAAETLGLIEINLQDACQVIVDILSRYKFEKAVFERRAAAELSAEEFCSLITEAQLATYGDGLDPELLHPYMWAVKGHYYRSGLAFYNFPYAFGLLFGLGLYARFEKEGASFAGTYRELLRMTGRASAVEVARTAGFDIEGMDFWRSGISVISARVDEFVSLAADFTHKG